jgi:hypothetical protein
MAVPVYAKSKAAALPENRFPHRCSPVSRAIRNCRRSIKLFTVGYIEKVLANATTFDYVDLDVPPLQ